MRNIDVLAVDLPRELFPSDKPLIVAAGGEPMRVPPPLPRRIHVHRQAGITENLTYSVSLDDPRPGKPYRPYAAGGLNSLYVSGEPLMIVRGTGGDNRDLVDSIARFSELLSKANQGFYIFKG